MQIDQVTNNLFNEIMKNKSSLENTFMSFGESKKTSISELTCSRDTNDWVPPNNTILNINSPSKSNDNGCSRQLFGSNVDSSNTTSSSSELEDVVGVEGRKQRRRGNKKINKRNEKQSGKDKSVQPNPCMNKNARINVKVNLLKRKGN